MTSWGVIIVDVIAIRITIIAIINIIVKIIMIIINNNIKIIHYSGASHGIMIGHVVPEAAHGGTIALIKDGDPIVIDLNTRLLTLDVPEFVIDALWPICFGIGILTLIVITWVFNDLKL